MNRILTCIDASGYAGSVLTLAAWSARQLLADVELLHVVQRKDAVAARRDLSGAIGLGVKSELLEELTRIDETEGKLAVEHGRVMLAGAFERLRGEGIAVETLHRHGGIVETIVEREAHADLVVIGKRGASGEFATDHIGSKVERVVRASEKPVLIASREVTQPASVVIAFDGSAAAMRAVQFVAGSPLFAGLEVHLVMAGPDDARHREQIDRAAAVFTAAKPSINLFKGRAEKVIGDFMLDRAGAMLVMGAYGHSPLRTLIVGSTTTIMIRTVHAPVLLVR
jgi:nucleotide-binding universal stress UspA family protein